MRIQGFGPDAQHLHLGRVRIGDKAPVESVGRSRNLCQGAGNQAAGAAFGRRDHDAPGAGGVKDLRRLAHISTVWAKAAADIVASAAKIPAHRSSSITPALSWRRSARPTSHGFQMSNSRKNRKAATQPG